VALLSGSKFRRDEIADWYDQHSKAILSYILFMVKDYQQAEDLTQDTFVKAYKYHDSFKQQSSERTWLFSIAHNVTIDFIRKKKPSMFLKDVLHLQKDTKPLPEEVIQLQGDSYELYKALGEIKSTYREVIILRKIKDFSIEDTAKILSCSESKVKSMLFRAMPVLKKQLIRGGFLDGKAI